MGDSVCRGGPLCVRAYARRSASPAGRRDRVVSPAVRRVRAAVPEVCRGSPDDQGSEVFATSSYLSAAANYR
jgi:hypothetical protein